MTESSPDARCQSDGRVYAPHTRRMMLFRQQSAFFYEAATFIAESRHRFPEITDFLSALPQEAQDESARIVGGVDPKSSHYIGDWRAGRSPLSRSSAGTDCKLAPDRRRLSVVACRFGGA